MAMDEMNRNGQHLNDNARPGRPVCTGVGDHPEVARTLGVHAEIGEPEAAGGIEDDI